MANVELSEHGWQPASTAPKNGTPIDVCVRGDLCSRLTDVFWYKSYNSPDGDWHIADSDPSNGEGVLKAPPFTHWMYPTEVLL